MTDFTITDTVGSRRTARALALGAVLAAFAVPACAGNAAGTAPAESLCPRPSTPTTCRNGVPVPNTVQGTLGGAAGMQDHALIIRTRDGGVLSAWCEDRCKDEWFDTHEPGTSITLKPELYGRKVTMVVTRERNGGRIAGEEEDAEFLFIQRIRLQK